MKKVGIVVTAILIVALLVGSFYFISKRKSNAVAEDPQMTEVQKLLTKDMDNNYPQTPREVVKHYNRIITAYYGEEMSEDELVSLAKITWSMFDSELQENNPVGDYLSQVQAEIASYKNSSKTISSSNVCDSDDVKYTKDGEDSLAFVDASYFMKEGNSYSRTYETYVLRKDSQGDWRILGYYQNAGKQSEDN